jgi:hypothetical protein
LPTSKIKEEREEWADEQRQELKQKYGGGGVNENEDGENMGLLYILPCVEQQERVSVTRIRHEN